MKGRSRGRIEDGRQLMLRLPPRVVWQKTARGAVAKTAAGILRAVQLPWRWWDGYLNEVVVAAGFTQAEVVAKLERLVRWRAGEPLAN